MIESEFCVCLDTSNILLFHGKWLQFYLQMFLVHKFADMPNPMRIHWLIIIPMQITLPGGYWLYHII